MFDSKKFILLVESRPVLYNSNLKVHNKKSEVSKSWSEIGCEMFDYFNDLPKKAKLGKCENLQKRWKSMKDNLRRALKDGCKKKKYIHFDRMKFMIPHLGKRNTSNRSGGSKNLRRCHTSEHITNSQNVMEPEEKTNLVYDDHSENKKSQAVNSQNFIMEILPKLLPENSNSKIGESVNDHVDNKRFLLLIEKSGNLPHNVVKNVCKDIMNILEKAVDEHSVQSSENPPENYPPDEENCVVSLWPALSNTRDFDDDVKPKAYDINGNCSPELRFVELFPELIEFTNLLIKY